MSRSELNISRWLEAHSDRSAGLKTLPRNLLLSDVFGDNDYRLILIDLKFDTRCHLKIYKGTLLVSDQTLPDLPNSLISFYTDHNVPEIPTIGVACPTELLFYKNNKPYYKFTVPSVPLLPQEELLWKNFLDNDSKNCDEFIEELTKLPYAELSGRAQELLNLDKNHEQYLMNSTNLPIRISPIIATSILIKSTQDCVSCPVFGTECGNIYILDPQSFTILHQANVSNVRTTPTIIRSSGTFDVDYRILIACRENSICLLRREWLEGKVLIQLSDDIVDMILAPNDYIIIATANKMLHNFTKRGQRVWSTALINHITCLCLVPLKHLNTHLIAVGLRGGMIHLYHGRQPVDYTNVPDTPSAIIFGQLGQEEHVMVVVTLNGTINFKILKRTADFNLTNQDKLTAAAPIQTKPLPLPKRSKLFLEQSQRERQNAVEIHQNFQQDLVKLRLIAARMLVENFNEHSGTGNEREQIKLSAQVIGLGPRFTLMLNLENMHTDRPIVNFLVNFHTKPTIYTLTEYLRQVPLIPPGLSYKIEIKVIENVEETTDQQTDQNNNRLIRVFVLRRNQNQPILAATINMPPTEI